MLPYHVHQTAYNQIRVGQIHIGAGFSVSDNSYVSFQYNTLYEKHTLTYNGYKQFFAFGLTTNDEG